MFHPNGPTFFELAEQAMSSTDRGYELLAEKFDHTPFRTPDELLVEVGKLLGEPGSIGSAIDVCCGTGAGLQMLRPLVRDRLVGVDRVQPMLDMARSHLPDGDGVAVELVKADALDLPFENAFDLAVCFGAFGHILVKDEEAFVASIYKALAPGGRFVFVTSRMPPPTHWSWWAARSFNLSMHVRNALFSPAFVMFYLTFLWPEVGEKLQKAGFTTEAKQGLLPAPFGRAFVVTATKPGSST